MKPFIFSADAHIAEPPDLYRNALPAHLQQWALSTEVDGESIVILMGEQKILKVYRNFHDHKTGQLDCPDVRRLGGRNLDARLQDMVRDGVDAELCYPSLGLQLPRVLDREAARISHEAYNDWAWEYTDGLHDKLVAGAMIPVINMDDAMAELDRVLKMGYRAVCLPSVLFDCTPNYNQPDWDPFFAVCGEAGVPICLHTATGDMPIRAMRGPGAAVYNYVRLMNDAVNSVCLLAAGGVLDRNPKARILLSEYGAGWLLALGERMDEAYFGHAPMVQPKLGRLPSQILSEQVVLCLQNDLGALKTLREQGVGSMVFATDYPHSEGTFPYSQELVDKILTETPHLTQEEREAVLGQTAVKLFKIDMDKARNAKMPERAAA
ncbi:amidohydrolase [Novosphingobium sp. KCTC 2891]|uniref:amidohydrolase family protein n=1 Tax=Novosphingobium sp. KCTC 2891 TaxID=2989730 RepID=UPI0022226514|nr:amidohydrolase family protein [Novosphingobium sp. KCTC 2891]MCW1384886.1 amidohydrolase [Novosphingobium sp. KCTC 2891]